MIIIDLYSGFETDRELIFTERISNQVTFKVKLWYGYFDSLMRQIPMTSNMHPDSVAYNWQTIEGFYDYELWECKRIQEFYNQLLSINSLPNEPGLSDALDALKQICNSTLQHGNRLFLEYL